jgi:hypothetical protein
MLGKLKEMAGSAAVDKALAHLEPIITDQLGKVQALGADTVQDDARFTQYIAEPAYLAVTAASNGITKLIPEFQPRFSRLMFRLRDDLFIVEGGAVRLVEDFKARLPTVLAECLKA